MDGRGKPRRTSRSRTRRNAIEQLESRELLTATVDSAVPVAAIAATPVVSVTALDLTLNGKTVTVRATSPLSVQVGDVLGVVGIHYTSAAAGSKGSVLACEGYLRNPNANSTGQSNSADNFNYADGRFGSPAGSDPLSVGEHLHPGLTGTWKITDGVDRLAIAMVLYTGDTAQTIGRFTEALQIGNPQLALDAAAIDQALKDHSFTTGQTVSLSGSWLNSGTGQASNYAEVDVYASTDLVHPVWVGTLAGTAGPNGQVKGGFTSPATASKKASAWVPSLAGTYVLKFTVDPEHQVSAATGAMQFFQSVVTVK